MKKDQQQALCVCPDGTLEILPVSELLRRNRMAAATPELCRSPVCVGSAHKCEHARAKLQAELDTDPEGGTVLTANEAEAVAQYCLDNGITDFDAGKEQYLRTQ